MPSCVNAQCNFTFTRYFLWYIIRHLIQQSRYTKPEFCPECQAQLGGTYVRKEKGKKFDNSEGDTVLVSPGIYSVRYHQHYRCLFPFSNMPTKVTEYHIMEDGGVSKCSYSNWMENRRLAVRNNTSFNCNHLKIAQNHILAGSLKR